MGFNSSGLIIQWTKVSHVCRANPYQDTFPIAFTNWLTGSYFNGPLYAGSYNAYPISLTQFDNTFFRTDGSYNYTMGNIWIGI